MLLEIYNGPLTLKEMKPVIAEEMKVRVCQGCAIRTGEWQIASCVDCCESEYKYFENGQKIYCDGEGNHYCEYHYLERRDADDNAK